MSSATFLAIFTDLMKSRIQHIIRSLTVSFLMAGFFAHLLGPFSSYAQKTAFARWLDYNIVSSGNENEVELRNTVKQLPEQTDDLWILIKEASELVANYSDQFKILVSNDDQPNSESGSAWLIEQWNMFQNQKSGFKSIFVENLKILSNWSPQNPEIISPSGISGFDQYSHSKRFFIHPGVIFNHLHQPLISGISINAP